MKFSISFATALAVLGCSVASAHQNHSLAELTLEELLNVEVTSVARKQQKVTKTAAAVYVVTNDDIKRSGATTLPDVLRMVPGLSVAQLNANTWSVTTRGFGGTHANKLLVMIDGRSVYTPLNGGVNWEMQLLPLDSIEQIEIVRGPGGSLWGSNAINGVINIITKSADQVGGGQVTTRVGASEPGAVDVHYGDKFGETGHYVAEGRYFPRQSQGLTANLAHGDDLDAAYGRTRIDWTKGSDKLSFHADASKGTGKQVVPTLQLTPPFKGSAQASSSFASGTSMLSWTHAQSNGVDSGFQIYYSGFARSWLRENSHTIDIDARQRRAVADRQEIVAGLQYRFTDSTVGTMRTIAITPAKVHAQLATAFVDDEIKLTNEIRLTAGTKIERNQDTGFEVQPSVRGLWNPSETQSVWAAMSRAVRTPNRFERGMHLITAVTPGQGALPVVITLDGSRDTSSEIVTAYETGYRVQRGACSVDFAGFVGSYDDLATHGRGAPGVGRVWDTPVIVVPLIAQNDGTGKTHGTEITGTWKPRPWWQVAGGYSWLAVQMGSQSSDGGSAAVVPINGPAPEHQFHLRSYVSVGRNLDASALFYHVSSLPAIGIPAYNRLDLRASWTAHPRVTLAAGAQNLLHDRIAEYADQTAQVVSAPVRPNVYGELAWRF